MPYSFHDRYSYISVAQLLSNFYSILFNSTQFATIPCSERALSTVFNSTLSKVFHSFQLPFPFRAIFQLPVLQLCHMRVLLLSGWVKQARLSLDSGRCHGHPFKRLCFMFLTRDILSVLLLKPETLEFPFWIGRCQAVCQGERPVIYKHVIDQSNLCINQSFQISNCYVCVWKKISASEGGKLSFLLFDCMTVGHKKLRAQNYPEH